MYPPTSSSLPDLSPPSISAPTVSPSANPQYYLHQENLSHQDYFYYGQRQVAPFQPLRKRNRVKIVNPETKKEVLLDSKPLEEEGGTHVPVGEVNPYFLPHSPQYMPQAIFYTNTVEYPQSSQVLLHSHCQWSSGDDEEASLETNFTSSSPFKFSPNANPFKPMVEEGTSPLKTQMDEGVEQKTVELKDKFSILEEENRRLKDEVNPFSALPFPTFPPSLPSHKVFPRCFSILFFLKSTYFTSFPYISISFPSFRLKDIPQWSRKWGI